METALDADDTSENPGFISRKRRRRTFIFALLLILAVVVETISFFATGFLARRGVVYKPNLTVDIDQYLAERHPLLGWPSIVPNERQPRDDSGARISPLFPDRAETLPAVSVYGDSFSWSAGVAEKDAWPEVLSELLDSRVDNFGVGGYGSDQALLRFRDNCDRDVEKAPVVILMHLTENILRNVNQYRDLLYPGSGVGLKPRFVVRSNGELQLVPLPGVSAGEFEQFVAEPEATLTHETFIRGGPSGPVRRQFPLTLTVIRSLWNSRIVASFRGEPWHMPFYDANHHSHGLAVTVGIMNAFDETARNRGQQPLVVILPTQRDFEYHERTETWPYKPLVEKLEQLQIPSLDLGPKMRKAMESQPFSDFYGTADPHLNERGYRIVGEIIHQELELRGLCP